MLTPSAAPPDKKTLEEKLRRRELAREAHWSRALAVGDADWLKAAARDLGLRRGQVAEADDCRYLIGRARASEGVRVTYFKKHPADK